VLGGGGGGGGVGVVAVAVVVVERAMVVGGWLSRVSLVSVWGHCGRCVARGVADTLIKITSQTQTSHHDVGNLQSNQRERNRELGVNTKRQQQRTSSRSVCQTGD
jgi:uncharacterized spore protein YtfJ